ncbi:hypothetical protein ACIQGZ_00750 [Streptomyces sp. NPDC092296]|uniref:hypothetical protein n=1 Tax=Streptomyces sp. NPDC092296 TaxID=3366012 RepID=UPI0038157C85
MARPSARHHLAPLLLLLAALLVPATAPAARAATPTILLDDLLNRPSVKPATFQVTWTAQLSGLHWTHWGTGLASGTGTLRINTCLPNCAQGHIRVLPGAHLQATGVRLDRNQPYYRQYRILAPTFSPADRTAYSHWTNAYTPSDFR